ncbi:MAG: 4-alpha-glucanotransferase [Candidatus Margulisiibacteriota bacterium]
MVNGISKGVGRVAKRMVPVVRLADLKSRESNGLKVGNATSLKKFADLLVKAGIHSFCLSTVFENNLSVGAFRNAINPAMIDLNNVLPEGVVREKEYSAFIEQNSSWLDNYAYFQVLHACFKGTPVRTLAKAYADVSSETAKRFIIENQEQIDRHKSIQFEAHRQLKEALSYAHSIGIEEIEALVDERVANYSADRLFVPETIDAPLTPGSDAMDRFTKSINLLNALGVDRIGIQNVCGLFRLEAKPSTEEEIFALLSALKAGAPNVSLAVEIEGEGDWRRQTEAAIHRMNGNGMDIAFLKVRPLQEYPAQRCNARDQIMLDPKAPDIRRFLLERPASSVQSALNNLGILFPAAQMQIQPSDLSTSFLHELYTRMTSGTFAGAVSIPTSSICSLNTSEGASIEAIGDALDGIRMFDGAYKGFGKVTTLRQLGDVQHAFYAQSAIVEEAAVAYQAKNGEWTVWDLPEKDYPYMEIAVCYSGDHAAGGFEGKAWARFDVSELDISEGLTYTLHDLVTRKRFAIKGSELLANGLNIGLNASQRRHHFVVTSNAKPVPYPDPKLMS